MGNFKEPNMGGLPLVGKKKSMLQQVMKPKDWVALSVLIIVSSFFWLWVLSAYSDPIDIDKIIQSNNTGVGIDNNVIL